MGNWGWCKKVGFFLVQRLNESRWLSIVEIYNPAWSLGGVGTTSGRSALS